MASGLLAYEPVSNFLTHLTGVRIQGKDVFASRNSPLPIGRKLDVMNTQPTFRVVGILTNGERTVISQHASREVAEHVVSLIKPDGKYREIVIDPKKVADRETPG